jgi:DNA topoisomerase II
VIILAQIVTGLTIYLQKAKAKAAPKKATAPLKAPKATKAAPKKMVQTTLKATKPTTKKRPKPESDDEDPPSDQDSLNDASLLSNTPPSAKKQKKAPANKSAGKPLQDIANDSMNLDGPSEPRPPPKKKSATEQYQKLTQLEHIMKRPDTYIGSVERTEQQMWVFNSDTSEMELRKVNFVPGLYKIFDEILVNAADNKQQDPTMKQIKVVVDREKGEISIENDGRGIPVQIHEVSRLSTAATEIALISFPEREDLYPRDDLWSPPHWIEL